MQVQWRSICKHSRGPAVSTAEDILKKTPLIFFNNINVKKTIKFFSVLEIVGPFCWWGVQTNPLNSPWVQA